MASKEWQGLHRVSRAAVTMPARPRTVCPQLRTLRCSAAIGEECHDLHVLVMQSAKDRAADYAANGLDGARSLHADRKKGAKGSHSDPFLGFGGRSDASNLSSGRAVAEAVVNECFSSNAAG